MDDGRVVNYGHLSSADVRVGDRIGPGTVVGASGNTGASTGPHLSFDVLDPNGNAIDPSDILGFQASGDNRVGFRSDAAAGVPAAAGVAGGSGGFDVSAYDIPALPFSTADYYGKLARWNVIDRKIAAYESQWDAWNKAMSDFSGYDAQRNPVAPPEEPISPLTPEEEEEYYSLSDSLDQWERIYEQQGEDLDRLLTILDHYSDTDPRLIDAENAADAFNRELDIRTEARQIAGDQYTEETDRQADAVASTGAFMRKETMAATVPYKRMTPYEDFYNKAREMVSAGLPEVPGKPYPFQMSGGQAGAFNARASSGVSTANSAFGGGPKITDRGRQRAEEGEAADNAAREAGPSTTARSATAQRLSDVFSFGQRRRQEPVRDTSAFRLADDLASRQQGPQLPMRSGYPTATSTPTPTRVGPSLATRTITPSILGR